MSTHPARQFWATTEALHAIVYFAPEFKAAGEAIGLKGYWMTYFAFRAAPMGPVPPSVVEATFASFHPRLVRRALPDAWTLTTPYACLEARLDVARQAYERAGVGEEAAGTGAERLSAIVAGLDLTGRPLGAANAAQELHGDPLKALWQLTSTFREHRGDGHVAALVSGGVSGPEAHVLQTYAKGTPHEKQRAARGWSEEEWNAVETELTDRGLVAAGALSDTGRELVAEIEKLTDENAWAGGLDQLGEDGVTELVQALRPAVQAVVETGALPFPNPVGLPNPLEL
ncbi:SCO6745 family protein [Tenggerimyces flavus]|uniref:SalK n=1 Tax=Tenggerimyces flavus TaxID=1708749 RepID=A0ABV7YAR5_9ACTN|nr:hypothetical protein [Tenggerimyces flavus]MBM7786913.1 hypothetical protein [Tenggerimyces flavus]